jgi:hypothetical protein
LEFRLDKPARSLDIQALRLYRDAALVLEAQPDEPDKPARKSEVSAYRLEAEQLDEPEIPGGIPATELRMAAIPDDRNRDQPADSWVWSTSQEAIPAKCYADLQLEIRVIENPSLQVRLMLT